MREIEFKFWLSIIKKMTYIHDLKEIAWIIPELTDDIIPLEYTGLKDKNGKKIFEGDVLDFNGIKNIIEFKTGMFCYNVSEHEKHPDYIPLSNYHFKWINDKSNELEIIGNIYENPELKK